MKKMKVIFITFFLVVAGINVLYADTYLSGDIAVDDTLTAEDSPYIINGDLTVLSGVTLTLEDSVTVKFDSNRSLFVYGTMSAIGTVYGISFTSSNVTPSAGDWDYIQIGDATYSGSATFLNCQIEYANQLYLYNGTAILTDCVLDNFYYYGVQVLADGTLAMTDVDIDLQGYASSGYGIYLLDNANSTLSNVDIVNCSRGLYITNENNSANLTDCTINSCDLPVYYSAPGEIILTGTNDFTGNTTDAIYIYHENNGNNWILPTANVPYYFEDTYTINTSGSMEIGTSNILKFKINDGLYVNGTLIAEADFGDNIFFTSEYDDNWGGDTNNDGASTSPASGNWYGVNFNDSSINANCIMRRCEVRYAGRSSTGGINMYDASPIIDECDISNNYYGIMVKYDSNPQISNTTIGSSDMVPLAISYEADPVLSANSFSFSDNAYDAIGLLGGTLTADATVRVRDFTAIPNVTYLMLDNITIPDGLQLTINKGIVIKAYYPYPYFPYHTDYRKFIIEGKIIADGTVDSLITFTSARDDNYGNPGDTNKDGSITSPVLRDWDGFYFSATADSTSILNYCRVQYGDNNDYQCYPVISPTVYRGGQITLNNSHPKISNCEIRNVEYGIFAGGAANPKIWNNLFENTTNTPINMSIFANPNFIGNSFNNTGYTALGLIGEEVSHDGSLEKKNIAGFTNITYLLLGNMYINNGTYIFVESGVVFKFGTNDGIYINGGFKADAVIDSMITFTSYKDDNFGNPGDTNGDGNATSPEAGDWQTITFNETSDDGFCSLDFVQVKYAGDDAEGCVGFLSAGGTVSNSIITNSESYGIRCDGNSTPNISDIEITNSNQDPIAMSLKSDPTFTNITFSGNTTNGIRILEGTLSSDATLSQRSVAGITNIAYIVNNLTINSNAVLTIEPGVVIKYPSGSYYNITVDGALNAVGTSTENIIFTSLQDDSVGGDTNNDGSTSTPSRGDWWCIAFNSSSIDSLNALKYCDIRYGGYKYYPGGHDFKWFGAVRIEDAFVSVDSSTIEQSYSSGIGIYGNADPSITNCYIINVNQTPITMSMFAEPVFQNNSSLNAGYMALGIVPENYSSNATIQKRDFSGYQNITYYLYTLGYPYNYKSTINSGTTIVIPEGVVFKFNNDSWQTNSLEVNGTLVINGSASEPVVFTDDRDDDYGNPLDTNGDGSASQPTISSNGINPNSCIYFSDISNDAGNFINHTILRYKEYGINLQQASPSITNCQFDTNNWGIVLYGLSEPIVDSCSFHDLTYSPLYMSLVSYPSSNNDNIISGTTYRALGVMGETLSQDLTLAKRDFGKLDGTPIVNIPYYFHSDYTIGTSTTLTINPGLVLKFNDNTKMIVNKGLIAQGGSNADSTIVFTEIKDDFYGGDTNADSTATTPGFDYYEDYWRGIYFEDQSLDPICLLDHCVFQYAGYSTNGNYGAIVTNNASPTISNTLIMNNRNGIVANGASNPIVTDCDIYNNVYFGINNVHQSFVINAENNWWGDNSGPTHSGNPGGTGDEVSDGVDYNPWLTNNANNPVVGDVSLNGGITAYDASLVLQDVVGSITLNEIQELVADVSAFGGITAYDASLILQYAVGLIHWFPAEINRQIYPKNDSLWDETLEYLAQQEPSDVILQVGSSSENISEQITIPLILENVSGVTSIQTILKYDTEILSISDISLTGHTNSMNLAFNENIETNELHIALAGTAILNTEGEFVYITFDINEEVKGINNIPITVMQFMANERDLTRFSEPGLIMVQDIPLNFAMQQNYPNPFNPTTTIQYQIPEDNSHVKMAVYNIKGQLVKTLVNKTMDTGFHQVVWNGKDNSGKKISSGMYFYKMDSGNFSKTRKLILLK